jgi:hypothetical protein
MEQRRLIITEGCPEIEGSFYVDAVLEDGRKIYGFWTPSPYARKYRFHVSLGCDESHTYTFRSLSAMVCAFNSKHILTINSDGGIVL